MLEDRRNLAEARAMAVARVYESGRGATVTDVSQGRDPRLTACLRELGLAEPPIASADLISVVGDERRIIEVKGRGSSGPIHIIERERDTFIAAGSSAWLYVVWNTTQPPPYRLILVQDPKRLPWVQTREAVREPGTSRGTCHEAQFQCHSEDVEQLGVEVDLSGFALPEKA